MKVSVITRHAVANYGSLLQAIATQRVIEDLGCSCEIIDYLPDCELPSRIEPEALKLKPEWNKNPLKRMAYLALRQPSALISGAYFKKWRNKHLKLTKRYSSLEALKNDKPSADIYMTGSDQVWGPAAGKSYDETYFLNFLEKSDKKIAYAASIGHLNLEGEEKAKIAELLKDYSAISVREASAVEQLKEMEISSSSVLDPTLLFDKSFWNSFIEKKKKSDKYILVYQIHNNPKLSEYAKLVSEKTGLSIVRVSVNFHQIFRCGSFKWLPDIGEFLAYIRDASLVITDSFHATAFSINFNVPFVEVLSQNGTQCRNQSILNLTGLEDRIITDFKSVDLINKPIDYKRVNGIIEDFRKDSLETLKNMMGLL